MTIAEKLQTIAENEQRVFDAGKNDVFKNMDSLNYFFADDLNSYYFDKISEYDLSGITKAQYIFQSSKKTEIKALSLPNVTYLHGMFKNCSSLEIVDFTDCNLKKAKVLTEMLYGCGALEQIKGTLDFPLAEYASRSFQGCSSLKEIRLAESSIAVSISFADSPLLTSESVQSVIDALATVTEAKAITFNEEITLTDAQIAEIDGKGWDLVQ